MSAALKPSKLRKAKRGTHCVQRVVRRSSCADVLATLLFRPGLPYPSGEVLVLGTEWDTTHRGLPLKDGTWRSLRAAIAEDIAPEHLAAFAAELRKLADALDTPNNELTRALRTDGTPETI